ncbi:MAG: hypothetical protein AAFO86_05695 [Pseudomonadota bacterium]
MGRVAWHNAMGRCAALVVCGWAMSAAAQSSVPHPAVTAFNAYCFKAGQTADQARANMEALLDGPLPFLLTFWDKSLEPAPGTPAHSERRCEVILKGDQATDAVQAVQAQMATPPVFGTPLPLPAPFEATPGTAYIEARELLRRRVAVVHIGLLGAGDETFLRVDRLPAGMGFGS